MSPRLLHVVEYAAIAVVLAYVAWLRGGELGPIFWILLVAPDIGLVLAPLLLWVAALIAGIAPWPLLAWLIHISADRALGFGLRGRDGGQALI